MTVSEREQEILEFWKKNSIFEKSVAERPEGRPYVFYDGPPFATGLPHYGHLTASILKDAVPRYWTMKGYRVERVWGWDCHGLPIENIIEEKLQLKSKKDIEEYGTRQFNEQCRATVLTYAEEWKKTIWRIGRWVDMENAYKTMDRPFMESVWWVFSELWKKGLIYEGKKAMHVCPRCVTPLSNFEVTQGYQEVTDISVTAKFKLTNAKEKLGIDGDVFLLAWTTTPWTLPGNVLLAVGPEIDYVVLSEKSESESAYILAKDRLSSYREKMKDAHFDIEKTLKGLDLLGLTYEPLFPYFARTKNAFRVVTADFVTTDDGTGVVHIAPAFGEDDYQLGALENVEFVQHVSMDGRFTKDVVDFAGQEVKPKEDSTKADIAILKMLAKKGKLFHKEKITHSYPHCWRCDTPLLNYATSSWFVAVTKIKDELLATNAKTAWVPEHMRDGRFGKWLEGARDWAISRDRFWGAPLPIWKADDGSMIVVGSVAELEALSGKTIGDIHKHIVDEIEIAKDGKTYRRIPQVLDCWFESGAMPYGQMHYPFENKKKFEAGFPAEFIAEGQDQTRGWFYTLHVLATALTSGKKPSIPVRESVPAFRHVVVNGIALAEDGKKMSKKLKNYPDPSAVIELYGADAVRAYILSSPIAYAENLNFSESGVRETYNKFVNMLWNVFSFLRQSGVEMCAEPMAPKRPRLLDRWILSRLANLQSRMTEQMDAYHIADAVRPLASFIADLSQWYVRRSRERLKGDDEQDRANCAETLAYVLFEFSKLTAPFTPFIAEQMHRELGEWDKKKDSVHLEAWPVPKKKFIDEHLEQQMERVREIVENAHALRVAAKIKVRQPLILLTIEDDLPSELRALIADEVNVKKVKKGKALILDTAITPELKKEGLVRELVRQINSLRKEAGLTRSDIIELVYDSDDHELGSAIDAHAETLKKSIVAMSVERKKIGGMNELDIDGKKISVCLEPRA